MDTKTAWPERVVLVDEHDQETGTEEKFRAHEMGLLHRAVSVFIMNARREVLLQRRSAAKYHSGGLWSNTACGHPRPGENPEVAARRRLGEEMGIACALTKAFDFTYSVELRQGLAEHEFDHVFVGHWDGTPTPDPNEVDAWGWHGADAIDAALRERPASFSAWFPMAWAGVKEVESDGDMKPTSE
jgi:isopentenyl-diphosphate Delta-isomerase